MSRTGIIGSWPKHDEDRQNRLRMLQHLPSHLLGLVHHQTALIYTRLTPRPGAESSDEHEQERRNLLAIAAEMQRRYER